MFRQAQVQYMYLSITQVWGICLTHVAAGQLAVSSGTDHVVGHQAAPPVGSVAGGLANHREKGLLQDVSDGTSGFKRESNIHIQWQN